MTGRLARLPLRTQLVALLLLSVALVVLVTSVAGTAALRSYLVDRIDDELVEVIRQPPQDAHGPRPGRGRKGDRRDVAVTTLLYDAQGALVTDFGTGTDEGGPDVRHPADLPTKPTDVADVDGGEGWRALALRTVTGGTYVAAVPLNGVDDTVSELLVINGAVGLMALGGVGVLAGWAVRRSLRPLRDVERTAEAIAAGDLSVRVPPADPRTEVGSLATSFDVMVDRFESAYCGSSARRSRPGRPSHACGASLRTRATSCAPRSRRSAGSPSSSGRALPETRTSWRRCCAASRTRRPGRACSSRTCCCWPGSTRPARCARSRSTCSRSRPTSCTPQRPSTPGRTRCSSTLTPARAARRRRR